MKVLSAIGGFFARIGRWIKETAWIQPLLIVGAIFAVIFAIPHIIDGVKGWFDESDAANKYFAKYQLALDKADQGKGESEVDTFFTYLEERDAETVKSKYGERFFVAFVQEDNSSCKDLYGGLKMFQDKWADKKEGEFKGLAGEFKLLTVYTDAVNENDESVNYFNEVWSNHIELFEDFGRNGYLAKTFYAQNKSYTDDNYINSFIGSSDTKTCPMSAPLVMYFDFSSDNPIENQRIVGLSDVIFSVDGSSDLEKARTLRNCWAHKDMFGELKNN